MQFRDLVDHLSRRLLHRPSTERAAQGLLPGRRARARRPGHAPGSPLFTDAWPRARRHDPRQPRPSTSADARVDPDRTHECPARPSAAPRTRRLRLPPGQPRPAERRRAESPRTAARRGARPARPRCSAPPVVTIGRPGAAAATRRTPSSVIVVALAARCRRRSVAGGAARRPGLLRRPARASAIPARGAGRQPTGSSACTRPWRRCCRCGTPASSRPSTPPGCRRRTGRTSPRWRSSRTPTPARPQRVGWLNRLVGSDDVQPRRCRAWPSGSSIPTSHARPRAGHVVRARSTPPAVAGGDRASDPRGRRMKALRTPVGARAGPRWRGGFREALDAVVDLDPAGAERSRRESLPGGRPRRARCRPSRAPCAPTSASRRSRSTAAAGTCTSASAPSAAGGCSATPHDLASAIAAFFTDLGAGARPGHPGDDQRVRPSGAGERQRRPRPRLGQRDAGRRRRREGRAVLRHAGPASTNTPRRRPRRSRPTTAASWRRSSRRAPPRRPPPSSPASSASASGSCSVSSRRGTPTYDDGPPPGGRAVGVRGGAEDQAFWIAEMSNSSLIFSETRTPPVSSAAFQVRPQSLRLMLVPPSKPMRRLPNGSRRRAVGLEGDRDRLGHALDGQVAGDDPVVAVALDLGGGEGDLLVVVGVEEVGRLEVAVAVRDAGVDAGGLDGQRRRGELAGLAASTCAVPENSVN